MSIESIDRSKLEIISGRNRFMDGLRRGKQLYRKRRFLQTAAVKGLEWLLIAKTKLTGHHNLDIINKMIGKEQVTGASNHTSDTDHASFERTFVENGYGLIADRLWFPAGLKMWDRPQVEWGMWGMNTVPTATPAYFEEALEILEWPLSTEEREMLLKYQANINWLRTASLRAMLPDWRSGQVMPMVYPETTRSRSGWIERGRREIDVYFRRGWIAPFMIQGPGEVFPPERNPNMGKILRGEFEVIVAAGELISGEVLHESKTLEWLKERQANPVDFVMSRVVILEPERANSTLRPFYDSLANDIPKGLILDAA